MIVLYWGVAPNWAKKPVIACASGLGVVLVPHVVWGPQKMATTLP